jgi:hypothetical protein
MPGGGPENRLIVRCPVLSASALSNPWISAPANSSPPTLPLSDGDLMFFRGTTTDKYSGQMSDDIMELNALHGIPNRSEYMLSIVE